MTLFTLMFFYAPQVLSGLVAAPVTYGLARYFGSQVRANDATARAARFATRP